MTSATASDPQPSTADDFARRAGAVIRRMYELGSAEERERSWRELVELENQLMVTVSGPDFVTGVNREGA
jgi:hypothetical protein